MWVGVGLGMAAGEVPWPAVFGLVAAIVAAAGRWRLALLMLCLGLLVGGGSAKSHSVAIAAAPSGPASGEGRVVGDPRPTRYGWAVAVRVEGLRYLVFTEERATVDWGDRVRVEGRFGLSSDNDRPGSTDGTVTGASIEFLAADPWMGVANAVRSRLLSVVDPPRSPERALLAGFLVGETGSLPVADEEALRRSGLSHFTAVSGSNVALFLGFWWVVLGPLGWTPRRRVVAGVIGVALFAAITRFEPSVMRASMTAAVVLVGRRLGFMLDGWTALGWAAALALLVSPGLGRSLGFQLSVAATIAVLGGSGLFRFEPGWLAAALSTAASAHILVGPLILTRIGVLPVLAPLANVLAAPLVVTATSLGGLGSVAGWDWLTGLGAAVAGLVLRVARTAVGWPQMGWLGLLASAGALLLFVRSVRARPTLLFGTSVVLMVVLVLPGRPPEPPAAVFLDVGQGDATLLLTEEAVVLIDGGPDELTLLRALQRHHIDRIDLVVVTHAHADHIDGLKAVLGRVPVGAMWQALAPHDTASATWLVDEVARLGIPSSAPEPGSTVQLGSVRIEVLAPTRRYAGTNDQSIVLLVVAPVGRLLLTGDVEAVAQQDLGVIDPDVLKVPHHGSDSSDLDWLARNSGELAVISVGAGNDYGHPDQVVIDTLEAAGAIVHRTDLAGDLVLDLDQG